MIIGITGFIASGKGELANILVTKYGFIPLSFGDAVRAEAKYQGLENTRATLQVLGDTMRHKYGGDIWAKRLLERVRPRHDYVIEGIRNPEEVALLRTNKEFKLICVDAPIDVRAQRVIVRKREGDPTNMEDFKIADLADKGEQASGFGQNTAKCVVLADYVLSNDTSIQMLQERLALTLGQIDKKRFGVVAVSSKKA